MTQKALVTCWHCFTERARLTIIAALGAALYTAAPAARACGWSPPSIEEATTFDQTVILPDLPPGVFYDPNRADYGYASKEEAQEMMLADWASRLGPDISTGDWTQILFHTDKEALTTISEFLKGTRDAPPKAFARNSAVTAPAALRPTLIAALDIVLFARRIEPFAAYHSQWEPAPPVDKAEADALLKEGPVALAKEKDPFFRQRRAFLLARLLFYNKKFDSLIRFAAEHEADLRAPSNDLWYRAQYYKAGALVRTKRRALANLLLARIHSEFPPLAGVTLNDFHPRERDDWSETLALAKTTEEKISLWRMVGIKYDPAAAVQEIQRLNPGDESLALLALRSVAKREYSSTYGNNDGSPDLTAVEQGVLSAAAAAQEDTNWKFYMIAAHISALRKDLTQTRKRLATAKRTAPKKKSVERQMSATELLALAHRIQPGNSADEGAFMRLLEAVDDPTYNRAGAVRYIALTSAAETYKRAGRTVEAALIYPWSTVIGPKLNGAHAANNAFMSRLLGRVQHPQTQFDKFIVKLSGYSPEQIKGHMAWLHLKQGEIAAARRRIKESGLEDVHLGFDLFSARINDCFDCMAVDPNAKTWTAGAFAEELVRLERKATGTAESAATAALRLGNALYQSFVKYKFWDSPRRAYIYLPGPNPALRWYRRAYQLTKNRERKAEAAFLAAKCEVHRTLAEMPPDKEPYAESPTWWGALKKLSDTAYQKQVLKECGWYRNWAEK